MHWIFHCFCSTKKSLNGVFAEEDNPGPKMQVSGVLCIFAVGDRSSAGNRNLGSSSRGIKDRNLDFQGFSGNAGEDFTSLSWPGALATFVPTFPPQNIAVKGMFGR